MKTICYDAIFPAAEINQTGAIQRIYRNQSFLVPFILSMPRRTQYLGSFQGVRKR
jgi:hypothetical protein